MSLEPATVQAVLTTAGLLDGPTPSEAPRFTGLDGSLGSVTRRAEVVADRLPDRAEPVLLQVSRWDRLKDMAGVLDAFVRHVAPQTEGITVGDLDYDAMRANRIQDGGDDTILWVAAGVPTPIRILQREDGADATDLRLIQYKGATP